MYTSRIPTKLTALLGILAMSLAVHGAARGADASAASERSAPSSNCGGEAAATCIDVRSILFGGLPESALKDTPWGASNWTLAEFQPEVPNGGRANTIAVHPQKNDTMLVASESGGLFKTTNGGKSWKHVDNLAPYFTNAVVFASSDPKVVIVTASEDFSKSNQGGIWRSEDEGDTWAPVLWLDPNTGKPKPVPSPSPGGLADRYSAFEISIAPDTGRIFVASSAGIEIGAPDGKSWLHHSLGVPSPQAMAVLALPEKSAGSGNVVLAGGAAGIMRSTDGGTKWAAAKSGPGCNTLSGKFFIGGCIVDMHALGASPAAKDQAYVINGDLKLYFTQDAGDTWTLIDGTPPGAPGCGGIAFIHVKPGAPAGNLALYFGNRCTLSYLSAPPLSGSNAFSYTGAWTELKSDHGDTRFLAFNSNDVPLLLATDGGIHKTADAGGNWTLTGGGAGGYNALQIYQVKGQWIDNIGQHNLYIGTQDNGLFSSADGGKTWVQCGVCNEGDFYEAQYHVATPADSQITIFNPFVNYRLSGTSLADGVKNWNNPPGKINQDPTTGHPKIVSANFHVQWVEDAFGLTLSGGKLVQQQVMAKGLAVTYSLGLPTASHPTGWQQYATIAGNRLDLPRASYPQKGEPVLYQALSNGTDVATNLEKGRLARLVPNPTTDDATTVYPAMKGFAGFGIPPTMEGWYRVFAVDPSDPDHLMAPDIINEKMMESKDAGENWKEMQQLTIQATDAGKLNFRGQIFFAQYPPLWALTFSPISQISVISFYPDNPQLVAVGTVQNGIFMSPDGGQTWKKVPGSEKATLISSLYWRKADEIFVSTYGRGLWRLTFKYKGPVLGIACRRPDCYRILYERPPKQRPSPYDEAIVAFGGQIRGVRVSDGILREIFVQPGTTLAYGVDSGDVPDIPVTETTASLQSLGAEPLPEAPPDAPIITGLTLGRAGTDRELIDVMYSPRPLSMFTPPPAAPAAVRPGAPGTPPSAGAPYLEAISGPESTPGEAIVLRGRGLPAGASIQVQIDGVEVLTVAADREGAFVTRLPAPGQAGFHVLSMAIGGGVQSGLIISVRPGE